MSENKFLCHRVNCAEYQMKDSTLCPKHWAEFNSASDPLDLPKSYVKYKGTTYEVSPTGSVDAFAVKRYDSDQSMIVSRGSEHLSHATNADIQEYLNEKFATGMTVGVDPSEDRRRCFVESCLGFRKSGHIYCPAHLPDPEADTRYNKPKMEPSANIEDIDKVIDSTEIYRRARAAINTAQRRQVGYGMEKYPEPLNADTWTAIETIDHIIEESIDKLHYLVMLRIKLESEGNT